MTWEKMILGEKEGLPFSNSKPNEFSTLFLYFMFSNVFKKQQMMFFKFLKKKLID